MLIHYKKILLLVCLLVAYLSLIVPFSSYMRSKPFAEKLGYIPQPAVLKAVAGDQKVLLADLLVLKSLFYFGSLVETRPAEMILPTDYASIYQTIDAAVKLDPYNQDAYYFAQAALSWHHERVKQANALLEYGQRFRDWDYQLPFFLGFNYAYFLHDYENAAKYYAQAAEISGDYLLANLAGRYLYESKQTELALTYLQAMAKSAKNDAIKETFQVRILALQEVQRIETALSRYQADFGDIAVTIEDLLQRGYLQGAPVDPYGGKFFINDAGRVRSTSKFAYAGGKDGKEERSMDSGSR